MLPGGEDYQLVYDIDLSNLGTKIKYDVDRSGEVKAFDRIGYLLELDSESAGEQKVFVSMKAFTSDPRKIGIPAVQTEVNFQQRIEEMQVYSNVDSLPAGDDIGTGNIEFWPNNYDEKNAKAIDGAAQNRFDFGDRPYGVPDGYGSMQIHDFGAKQTIFAINHWRQGANADIGIGNSKGRTRDWTFTRNANSYTSKRLRVYVRPGTPR